MIVETDARLDWPQQDGTTKRKHLQSIARQSGKTPEELIVPEVPPAGLYIKWVFDQLSITREWKDGSPSMIKQDDIYYWCQLHNTTLTEWHLSTLQKLDIYQINSYVKCINERSH